MIARKRSPIALAIILSGALAAFAATNEHPEAVAQSAALAWLAQLDNADYPGCWDAAATLFRQKITRDDWQARVASVRGALGALKSRKMRSETYTHALPGAPSGDYVVILFDSSFAQKESAVETVTPMKDSDGAWRVSGYFIK
jgi:hypothetical protein